MRAGDCAAACRCLRILVAEDNELTREVMRSLLNLAGLECECAENGAVCLERFCAQPGRFDAILMDVQMPKLNGLEATRRIRALEIPEAKRIPIIALTADNRSMDIEECLAAGMNLHLSKPVDMPKLLRVLAALCGKET